MVAKRILVYEKWYPLIRYFPADEKQTFYHLGGTQAQREPTPAKLLCAVVQIGNIPAISCAYHRVSCSYVGDGTSQLPNEWEEKHKLSRHVQRGKL